MKNLLIIDIADNRIAEANTESQQAVNNILQINNIFQHTHKGISMINNI